MLPQFVLEYGERWGRHYVFRKLIPVWDFAKREEFFTAKVIWRFTSISQFTTETTKEVRSNI